MYFEHSTAASRSSQPCSSGAVASVCVCACALCPSQDDLAYTSCVHYMWKFGGVLGSGAVALVMYDTRRHATF